MQNKNIIIFCIAICMTLVMGFILTRDILVQKTIIEAFDTQSYDTVLGQHDAAYMLHNKGSAMVGIYDDSGDISHLQEALLYLSGSLKKQSHPQTQSNYDMLLKKLKSEEQKQEEEKQKDSQEQSGQGEEDQDSNDPSSGSGVVQENRSQEHQLSGDEEIQTLTQEEKQAIEEYSEDLKQQQQRFQEKLGNYGKPQDMFDMMVEDFFGGSLRGSEKDW